MKAVPALSLRMRNSSGLATGPHSQCTTLRSDDSDYLGCKQTLRYAVKDNMGIEP